MISVVIPTRDDARRLGPCLGALTPGLSHGVLREVIFADAGSTDDTAEIADLTGARFMAGASLRAAGAAARGPWLLIIAPAAVLDAGWPDAARRHVLRGDRRAGWFPLRAEDAGLSAAARVALRTWRARLLARPALENGLLIARALCHRLTTQDDCGDARRAHAALVGALGRRRLSPLAARVTLTPDAPHEGPDPPEAQ